MDRSNNPEGDKNKPQASGTSGKKRSRFTPQPDSDRSAYLSTGYKNAKTVARMAERFFTQGGVTGIEKEKDRNRYKDQALLRIKDIRKAKVDLSTAVKYHNDVKQYIFPDRSGSSSSHPPLGKALDDMSLEELQATKEKVQELQKAAEFAKQAESAKKDLESANKLRPLKHHQTDLAEMKKIVQVGQTLKDDPDLDFTTLSQKCKELQRLIEPKIVVARVRPDIFEAAAGMIDPEDLGKFQKLEKFQRQFEVRNAVESALAAECRVEQYEDFWRSRTGLYIHNGPLYHMGEETKLTDKLAGDEIIMNAQLKELLAKRPKNGKPVILVDFGGGFGLSMIRLAAKHRSAIESGNLVIVVTNLGYLPKAEADGDKYSGVARSLKHDEEVGKNFSPEELKFVQNNQGLVTYIDAIAAELPSKLVQHQEKQPMSLVGTVDIIYQRLSVVHTDAPDVALAVFGELLSDQGTLYLDARDPLRVPVDERTIQVADGRTIKIGTESYQEDKYEALEVGVTLLQNKYAMKKIFEDDLFYSVLAKPHAPDFPEIEPSSR